MPGSVASISAHVRPFASSSPSRWLRDSVRPAGRDDVADPGQAGERERVGAGGDPEPRHLGQAAGHQPGLAVVAEPERVGRPGRDRDDVLERPAQLDAEDVLVDVQPERAAAEPRRDALGELEVRSAATTAEAGRPRAISSGEVRAGQRRDPGGGIAAGRRR